MSDKPQRWQMVIWTGADFRIPITVYGESLADLKIHIIEWLTANQPKLFTNLASTQEQKDRYSYAYLEGANRPIISPKDPFESVDENDEKVLLDEGWYSVDNQGYYGFSPRRYENFDKVVSHFVEHAIIPKKGPDYKEIGLNEKNFPLHLIRKVRHVEKEIEMNDLLQRGWYILTLDYKGHEDHYGRQVVNRTTIYVLGHPEEDAY